MLQLVTSPVLQLWQINSTAWIPKELLYSAEEIHFV